MSADLKTFKRCKSCIYSDFYGLPQRMNSNLCVTCRDGDNYGVAGLIKNYKYPEKVKVHEYPWHQNLLKDHAAILSKITKSAGVTLQIETISNGWIIKYKDEKIYCKTKDRLFGYIRGLI